MPGSPVCHGLCWYSPEPSHRRLLSLLENILWNLCGAVALSLVEFGLFLYIEMYVRIANNLCDFVIGSSVGFACNISFCVAGCPAKNDFGMFAIYL